MKSIRVCTGCTNKSALPFCNSELFESEGSQEIMVHEDTPIQLLELYVQFNILLQDTK